MLLNCAFHTAIYIHKRTFDIIHGVAASHQI
jgi:hypothetical protein